VTWARVSVRSTPFNMYGADGSQASQRWHSLTGASLRAQLATRQPDGDTVMAPSLKTTSNIIGVGLQLRSGQCSDGAHVWEPPSKLPQFCRESSGCIPVLPVQQVTAVDVQGRNVLIHGITHGHTASFSRCWHTAHGGRLLIGALQNSLHCCHPQGLTMQIPSSC